MSPALAGGFFTTELPGKPINQLYFNKKNNNPILLATEQDSLCFGHLCGDSASPSVEGQAHCGACWGQEQRGKEEKRQGCPHNDCLPAPSPHISSLLARKRKFLLEIFFFFPVCGCHSALEFGPPKSKSNLESWELKN